MNRKPLYGRGDIAEVLAVDEPISMLNHSDGIVLSPGAFLRFEERGIRIKGLAASGTFLDFDHIKRIIYS